jgi:hypothetical protein
LGSFDGISILFVLFGQGDGEFVLALTTVEVGSDSSEFEKFVFFGEFGEGKLVE